MKSWAAEEEKKRRRVEDQRRKGREGRVKQRMKLGE